MPIITLHNAETGEIETREMNGEELAQLEIDKTNSLTRQEADAAQEAARAALLAKLGITADEARLLLGGN